MSRPPVLCVAGLGRCGSSRTMQMLYLGGLRCAGEWPDFETDEVNNNCVSREFAQTYRGGAIKWLNPHLTPLPSDIPRAVIWLSRNPREQARSACKFMGLQSVSRSNIRALAASFKSDERKITPRLLAAGPVLHITFEALVSRQAETAGSIAQFVAAHLGRDLDQGRMVQSFIQRGPMCRPDTAIEALLASSPAPSFSIGGS